MLNIKRKGKNICCSKTVRTQGNSILFILDSQEARPLTESVEESVLLSLIQNSVLAIPSSK